MSTATDVSWRWWPGDTFEEEWKATSTACGARAIVVEKYFPRAYKRLSTYQKGLLKSVVLPTTKSSDTTAELMFCDSYIVNCHDRCTGFNYCVEYTHPATKQRFWFCDNCSISYKQWISIGQNMHVDPDEKGDWQQVGGSAARI